MTLILGRFADYRPIPRLVTNSAFDFPRTLDREGFEPYHPTSSVKPVQSQTSSVTNQFSQGSTGPGIGDTGHRTRDRGHRPSIGQDSRSARTLDRPGLSIGQDSRSASIRSPALDRSAAGTAAGTAAGDRGHWAGDRGHWAGLRGPTGLFAARSRAYSEQLPHGARAAARRRLRPCFAQIIL